MLEVTRKMSNEVLWCVYVLSSVDCALGCVYSLLTFF